jgi:phosphatidylglycerophosphate synthase
MSARRPIKARDSAWAGAAAARLAVAGVTPNQISIASVACAALSSLAFLGARFTRGAPQAALLVLAAAAIQLRLLCNLLDGMVAVEGGLKTKSGEIFNDMPDRIADPLVLVGAGYLPGDPMSVTLGWLAALLAVLTAYVRVLGGSAGATQLFIGPMAKQHRMAVMTAAATLAALEALVGAPHLVVTAALGVIVVGCVATVVRRLTRIVAELESG